MERSVIMWVWRQKYFNKYDWFARVAEIFESNFEKQMEL